MTVSLLRIALVSILFAVAALADLPDGAGKTELIKVCGKCHSVEQATSLHQSQAAWQDEIAKMVGMGAEGTDEELNSILFYLSRNFGPEKPKPINVNTASAVELESSLGFTKTEAAALVDYRTHNEGLKSLDDLKKVPGLDAKKIDAGKERIAF